ncbi:para-nitrobenzyl esterase [Syntrophus gentianae]|uniref:Para-nitrobenzyl esterase n=2 Tax=Syntrophus gentianae TaxID=43775 RepID=A0A1H7ZAK9_9BACT|nr:para-nitrobenzyl esterase [Syntrophus gentianae]
MRLSCNRAKGTWAAEPSGSGESGRFEFGALAVTRAFCPFPNMNERILADAKFVRSYLLVKCGVKCGDTSRIYV